MKQHRAATGLAVVSFLAPPAHHLDPCPPPIGPCLVSMQPAAPHGEPPSQYLAYLEPQSSTQTSSATTWPDLRLAFSIAPQSSATSQR